MRPSDNEAPHGGVDHGFRDIETALVVSDEAAISGEPAKCALDDPSSRQDVEARIGAADDFHDEIEEGGLVQELTSIIGAVGEQTLDPGPALADGVEDGLCSGAVGDIGGGEVDHQQTPIRIHGDVPFAADDLLAAIESRAPRLRPEP